jgi:hypothetical protein
MAQTNKIARNPSPGNASPPFHQDMGFRHVPPSQFDASAPPRPTAAELREQERRHLASHGNPTDIQPR